MVYFLYGEDSYRSREKMSSIVTRYREKHADGDMGIFDFSERDEPTRCVDFFDTPGLFASKKLAVVLRPFAASAADALKRLTHAKEVLTDKDRILVLWSEEEKIPALFKFLTAAPVFAEQFEALNGAHLRAWVLARAKKHGVSLENDLIAELTRAFGADLWMLENEIKKLSSSGHTSVSLEFAQKISQYPGTSSVFSFSDAFWKKSPQSLEMLERVIQSGDSADHIAGLLVSQSRMMLNIKSGAPAKGNPFYIRNLTALGNRLSADELDGIHQAFARGEAAVRTGARDWERIIAEMCLERSGAR
jgi:DNA polymerase III delta subunit